MTVERFGPVEPLLDHLVYAVPDLAAAVVAFTAASGVEPAEGGRHLGFGTRNFLVGLGPTSYLEIIGPDHENPAEAGMPMPFGIDTRTPPRLVTWLAQVSDLETATTASAAAGADLGAIRPMSRRTPAGELLEWRLATRFPAPFDGITPALIDWGATRHPAALPALPSLALQGLLARHPDAGGVTAVLDALGLQLAVDTGPAALAALIDTPRGPVVLR